MLQFLKSLFETPKGDFPSLMDSRDPKVELTATTISTAVTALKPLVLPAFLLQLGIKSPSELPELPAGTLWPINKKKKPLCYLGTIQTNDYKLLIFMHEDGFKKNHSNLQYFYLPKAEWHKLQELKPENQHLITNSFYDQKPLNSLPIWEEIIHRYPDVHKLIVKNAPQHPWTLYKTAHKELCHPETQQQLNGYPQWLINNIDFRKIKNLEFIAQLQDVNSSQFVYLFKNGVEIECFFQEF